MEDEQISNTMIREDENIKRKLEQRLVEELMIKIRGFPEDENFIRNLFNC